jgi:hypothetical protein
VAGLVRRVGLTPAFLAARRACGVRSSTPAGRSLAVVLIALEHDAEPAAARQRLRITAASEETLCRTAVYLALGIPRALLLGPLTAVCSIVPVVGPGLVCIPLAIELAATSDY